MAQIQKKIYPQLIISLGSAGNIKIPIYSLSDKSKKVIQITNIFLPPRKMWSNVFAKIIKDKIMKERLLYWNFEYDSSPWRLYQYDDLLSMFSKKTESQLLEEKEWYDQLYKQTVMKYWKSYNTGYEYKIVCDPASHGRDWAIITVWNKFSIEEIIIFTYSDLTELEQEITKLRDKYLIWPRETIVDEDWVWWWLKDALKCRWFINNASPIQPDKAKKNPLDRVNFQNLKTQCYFQLQNYIWVIAISLEKVKILWKWSSDISVEEVRKRIIDDLDAIVEVDIDKDWPKRIIDKQSIKDKLWRSPDMWDNIMMRMYWEVKNPKRVFTYSS